jgi:hypothetical protein
MGDKIEGMYPFVFRYYRMFIEGRLWACSIYTWNEIDITSSQVLKTEYYYRIHEIDVLYRCFRDIIDTMDRICSVGDDLWPDKLDACISKSKYQVFVDLCESMFRSDEQIHSMNELNKGFVIKDELDHSIGNRKGVAYQRDLSSVDEYATEMILFMFDYDFQGNYAYTSVRKKLGY